MQGALRGGVDRRRGLGLAAGLLRRRLLEADFIGHSVALEVDIMQHHPQRARAREVERPGHVLYVALFPVEPVPPPADLDALLREAVLEVPARPAPGSPEPMSRVHAAGSSSPADHAARRLSVVEKNF